MNFVSAVKSCFRQYADFSGKASRSEFWWFQLFVIVVAVASGMMERTYNMLGIIVLLTLTLPSWAVSVRRLHDVGRSGWWSLLSVTGIGNLVLLYWFVQPSKE